MEESLEKQNVLTKVFQAIKIIFNVFFLTHDLTFVFQVFLAIQ